MKRELFVKVVAETLDSLPQEFRSRIRSGAVLVENAPPKQPSPLSGQPRRLLLGVFHGAPMTKKSIFDLPIGPDHIGLYQKNIEAKLLHYFGMDENQLWNAIQSQEYFDSVLAEPRE